MGLSDASDSRLTALTEWVVDGLGFAGSKIEPASADASFRRYFRLTRESDTFIIMDAPPGKEDVAPFISVARLLAGLGLNVPIILAQDAPRGFLLLSDLGSRQYLDELEAGRDVDRLYDDALAALATLQTTGVVDARRLPAYDAGMLAREMELMPEWFLDRHLGLILDDAARGMLRRLSDCLIEAALAQPATLVHRDYHSRNLLLTPQHNPGILDFQDAVFGPATYDVVSLLKDCYITWPKQRMHGWLMQYRSRLLAAGLVVGSSAEDFVRSFDLMGLQRHVKVLGIFARLFYRDGKRGYLKDLPRVLAYVLEAASAYPETQEFARFLNEHVQPSFRAAQRRVGAPGTTP